MLSIRDNSDEGNYKPMHGTVYFAFVDEDDCVVAIFDTCRELIAYKIFRKLNNINGDRVKGICFDKLKIAIGYIPSRSYINPSEKLKAAVDGLNILGKCAKFPYDMKLIEATTKKFGNNTWLLSGPPDWLKNPQIFSFMLWFIRMNIVYKVDNGSRKKIVTSLKKIRKAGIKYHDNMIFEEKEYDDDVIVDLEYLHDKISTIFLWYDHIFKMEDNNIVSCYNEKFSSYFSDYSGIVSFTDKISVSTNTEAKERLFRIMKLRGRKGKI